MTGGYNIESYTQQIGNADMSERQVGVLNLSYAWPNSAPEARARILLALFIAQADKSESVREEVALAFERISANAGKDTIEKIRDMQSTPLECIEGPVLKEASKLASGDPNVREAALIALGAMGKKSAPALHVIRLLLSDSNEFVREQAGRTLEAITHAVEKMSEKSAGPGDRIKLAMAFGKMDPPLAQKMQQPGSQPNKPPLLQSK